MPIQRKPYMANRLSLNWWKKPSTETKSTVAPAIVDSATVDSTAVVAHIKPKSSLLHKLRFALRLLIWPLATLINLLFTLALIIGAFFIWIIPTLPDDATIINVSRLQPLVVYNTEGKRMGEFGAVRREPIRYTDTPPLLIKAFVAAEDSRFFEHSGVDIQGLGRAILNLLRTGEPSQGGSTITMQLVRNLFLTPERSLKRKLSELVLAMHLEARFSKEQIFELYENRIFFGHHAYGVAAAAKVYYNRRVDQLSLAQMATLAGIPQAPSIHNPITDPQRSIIRRAYVLRRMLALGWITQAQHDEANAAAEDARLTVHPIELDAPHATEMARREARELYGTDGYNAGLRITTTIDAKLQDMAQRAVVAALLEYDRRHGYRGAEASTDPNSSREDMDKLLARHLPTQGLEAGVVLKTSASEAILYLGAGREAKLDSTGVAWAITTAQSRKKGRSLTTLLKPGDIIRVSSDNQGKLMLAQIPAAEGALVVLSPRDGAIKALVGGFDFKRSQFNRAADARRQPGSSFKPFVYAAALAEGWTSESIVDDAPLQIRTGRRVWRPKNFDGQFLGKISLQKALAESRNLASVQLLRSLGVEKVRSFAMRFGFKPEQLPHGLSLVLGSGEAPPLQMAGAYAVFANGGFRVDPYLMAKVEDAEGRIVSQTQPLMGALGVPTSQKACVGCGNLPPDIKALVPTALTSGSSIGTSSSTATESRVTVVLEPAVAATMRNLLQEVIRTGTGKRALALGQDDIAGKTGTSNGVRDAWFCGFNTNMVVVAWMGFDDYSRLGSEEVGGNSALGMWMTFMAEALEVPHERLLLPGSKQIATPMMVDDQDVAHAQRQRATSDTKEVVVQDTDDSDAQGSQTLEYTKEVIVQDTDDFDAHKQPTSKQIQMGDKPIIKTDSTHKAVNPSQSKPMPQLQLQQPRITPTKSQKRQQSQPKGLKSPSGQLPSKT